MHLTRWSLKWKGFLHFGHSKDHQNTRVSKRPRWCLGPIASILGSPPSPFFGVLRCGASPHAGILRWTMVHGVVESAGRTLFAPFFRWGQCQRRQRGIWSVCDSCVRFLPSRCLFKRLCARAEPALEQRLARTISIPVFEFFEWPPAHTQRSKTETDLCNLPETKKTLPPPPRMQTVPDLARSRNGTFSTLHMQL